jgi:hypothetical protein
VGSAEVTVSGEEMGDEEYLKSDKHIIPSDPDGPVVETGEYLEELEAYQEQFENEQFESLASGKYIPGTDPAECSLIELLVRYTSLSMVQLTDDTRFAITQLSMQFEQIFTANELGQHVRVLLGYLQIPLLRLAMQDEKFLSDINNAAIRLFYKLSDIAALWSPQSSAHTDMLYKSIASAVEKVRNAEPLTYKLCEELLDGLIAADFTALYEPGEVSDVMESVAESEAGVSEDSEENNELLEEAASDLEVEIIEEQEKALEDELLESAASDIEDEIVEEHEQAIEATQAEVVVSKAANEQIIDVKPDAEEDESGEEPDRFREIVDAINIGVRLDYHSDGEVQKLKVVAILPKTAEVVLVNRNQEKVGSFDRDDIYDELKAGTMVVDENTLVFDSALESIIGHRKK